MSAITDAIVRVAKSKLNRKDWMAAVAKDNFEVGANKCNQFVYDVLVEAGVKPAPTVPHRFVLRRAPLAREWADPTIIITGWLVVPDPRPGDVIAEAREYTDATGHVGIVVGDKLTASANAHFGGMITINHWGFDDKVRPVFRRYNR